MNGVRHLKRAMLVFAVLLAPVGLSRTVNQAKSNEPGAPRPVFQAQIPVLSEFQPSPAPNYTPRTSPGNPAPVSASKNVHCEED